MRVARCRDDLLKTLEIFLLLLSKLNEIQIEKLKIVGSTEYMRGCLEIDAIEDSKLL